MNQTRNILLDSADLIEKQGWWPGFGSGICNLFPECECLMTSMHRVCYQIRDRNVLFRSELDKLYTNAEIAVARLIPARFNGNLDVFNDWHKGNMWGGIIMVTLLRRAAANVND